jgi:hypothetical protein
MIKGYRKNMIAVNGGDGDIFETAYFILKDGHSGEEISENDMLIEAEKIIEKNLLNGEASKNSDKKKKSSEKTGSKAIIPFAAGATVGSAVGLLWLLL